MRHTQTTHITVLRTEAVDALSLNKDARVVDATLGAGGHSREIYARLGKDGVLIGLDADQTAVSHAREHLFPYEKSGPAVYLRNANFKDIQSVLQELGIKQVDAILADLGWRQEQFGGDASVGGGKGFSFQGSEPLHMTYGDPEEYLFTAEDIVNDWDESSIIDVLKGYGEERYARRIASAIVEARHGARITTTQRLVDIIESAVPARYRYGRIHPATRTFQAFRIAVNDELGILKAFISDAIDVLESGGRLAIITFHSLEDRIVKHAFRDYAREEVGVPITKRPITADEEEVAENPRARSAKLRVFEKR